MALLTLSFLKYCQILILSDLLKKIFIIAPHFPPSALPPAQRVRLLVKHCANNGVFPYAFTVSPKHREEISDNWMTELLGNDYEEIIVRCLPPKLTRKLGFGDLGLRMLPFLWFTLLRESIRLKPEFILYPVPPWYILLVAPWIKWLTGIKYGIDFIDPWVHHDNMKNSSFKYNASQWIARVFEGWVVKHASIVFSVSEGINTNLVQRHPKLGQVPMLAVPYGAEPNDFNIISTQVLNNERLTIRYIGAIWADCYPVLDGLMASFSLLSNRYDFLLEFYGTSYAGQGLAKAQLEPWFTKYSLSDRAKEQPLRVPYKNAVELTMSSDILFLIGGMQPYYAASKLMGLIASRKPFIAFVHKDSFPAKFLAELNYPYLITYSSLELELPIHQSKQLFDVFEKLIKDKDTFIPIDLEHPLVRQHTAEGMTQFFLNNIKKILL